MIYLFYKKGGVFLKNIINKFYFYFFDLVLNLFKEIENSSVSYIQYIFIVIFSISILIIIIGSLFKYRDIKVSFIETKKIIKMLIINFLLFNIYIEILGRCNFSLLIEEYSKNLNNSKFSLFFLTTTIIILFSQCFETFGDFLLPIEFLNCAIKNNNEIYKKFSADIIINSICQISFLIILSAGLNIKNPFVSILFLFFYYPFKKRTFNIIRTLFSEEIVVVN